MVKKATVLPLRGNDDGTMNVALRHDDGSVSLGRFDPIEEGRPIHDLTRFAEVRDRPGTPFLDATFPFAVEEAEEAPEPTGKGPAKVNSQAYRDAWDRIFGKPAGEA